MPKPAPRVLSLLSASTEIVSRLGCSHLLVGRSHGCDDPPLVTSLPITTAPKMDPNASSADIDDAVRAQSTTGGPIYKINSPLVRSLSPTVIITQRQCRVCAVTPEDVDSSLSSNPTVKMVTIMPVTLSDVLSDIETIASALGVPERGQRLVSSLRHRLAYVSSVVLSLPSPPRPKVMHVEWLSPLMGSGYWIAELVETAGCDMINGQVGGHSPVLKGANEMSDADIIILAPCGFGVERTRREMAELKLAEDEGWKQLKAVKNGMVFVADGNLFFNRSSCTVIETAEMVAEMAHPELAALWGHHGRHWVRMGELDSFCLREGASPVHKEIQLADKNEKDEGKDNNSNEAALTPTPPPPPSSFKTAIEFVQHQVELLRARKFVEAFEMNSDKNKARLGSAQKFEAIVNSNPSFAALADPSNPPCQYQSSCGEGETRTVQRADNSTENRQNPIASLPLLSEIRV
ncbi:hypothetical protein TrST_g6948 [Triparma strigata]|uniref:Fe/B12 periplasmic-binding domain-containing protein n=1 Tax=Triparma strigata TaxID=1606541 RepID=A0A9W7C2I4_9STRA|nr:hypothetical protein TrST_g6948 [Triparma strigata]